MGQRLNLEIWNNGKGLANSYYHWDAYTSTAADVTKAALQYIFDNPFDGENEILYAIRILEATGAGLTDRELEYAQTVDCLFGEKFSPCKGRNNGLIGISDNEIASTRSWYEYAAYIFLDEKRISFKVFWTQRKWEYEKEQKEDYGNEINWKVLTRAAWNTDDIKFDKWDEFYNFIKSLNDGVWVSTMNPYVVNMCIE